MSSELLSVFAQTSNSAYNAQLTTATSGALLLGSTLWSGYVTSIRIPKGCAFKVWESKVFSHNPATVHIQATMSGTGTVYTTLETDSVATSGVEQRTVRAGRPLVVESHDGERAIRFLFDGSIFGNDFTSSVVLASYNVEIVELNAE